MRSDLEMTAEILRQVRERRAAQKKRRAVLGLSAGTLAVAVVAVGVVWGTALHRKPDAEPTVGVSLVTSPALGGSPETVPQPDGTPETATDGFGGAFATVPSTPPAGEETSVSSPAAPEIGTTVGVTSGAVSTTAVPAIIYESAVTSSAAEQPSTTQNCTTSSYLSGGNSELYVLPEKSAKEQLERSGEQLTDKQAKAYFKENLPWLQSALSASGVSADDLRVSERGYGHVFFENFANSGKQTPVCAIRQNFRDYPVNTKVKSCCSCISAGRRSLCSHPTARCEIRRGWSLCRTSAVSRSRMLSFTATKRCMCRKLWQLFAGLTLSAPHGRRRDASCGARCEKAHRAFSARHLPRGPAAALRRAATLRGTEQWGSRRIICRQPNRRAVCHFAEPFRKSCAFRAAFFFRALAFCCRRTLKKRSSRNFLLTEKNKCAILFT